MPRKHTYVFFIFYVNFETMLVSLGSFWRSWDLSTYNSYVDWAVLAVEEDRKWGEKLSLFLRVSARTLDSNIPRRMSGAGDRVRFLKAKWRHAHHFKAFVLAELDVIYLNPPGE